MIKISPLDIRQQEFKQRFRGYDIEEVAAFQELIASELERILQDVQRLKEELELKQKEIENFISSEQDIKRALLTAQKLSDNLKQGATKEAQLIIKEAELKAEEIVKKASREKEMVLKEIEELRKQKKLFDSKMRANLESFMKLLDMDKEPINTGTGEDDKLRIIKKG